MEPKDTDKSVNLAELLSAWIFLAEEAGNIIRNIHDSGKLKTELKDEDDPVTLADFTIQKTIEYNLKKLYPGLSIVGEEDSSKYEHIAPTVEDIDEKIKAIVDEQLLRDTYERRKEILETSQYKDILAADPFNFKIEDAELWIDPLDGTRDFVKGRLHNVTCLIGIAINKISKAGVVHSPVNEDGSFPGPTYFGSVESGAFERINGENIYLPPFENDVDISNDHELSLTLTHNRFDDNMRNMVDSLQPCKYIQQGGSGNKTITVLKEKCDCFIYPMKGMSGWDACACEALIKARLGTVTDALTKPFTYSKGMEKIDGIIVTRSPQISNIVTKRLKDFIISLKAAL